MRLAPATLGSSRLTSSALDSIPVVFPQRVGDLTVELVGYTGTKGAREYNYSLSQRRVDAVRRFLVEKGVQPSRIQAVG